MRDERWDCPETRPDIVLPEARPDEVLGPRRDAERRQAPRVTEVAEVSGDRQLERPLAVRLGIPLAQPAGAQRLALGDHIGRRHPARELLLELPAVGRG